MKKLGLFVFALCLSSLAFAGPSSGTAAQILFTVNPLGSVNWTPVFSKTLKGIKGLQIFSSASLPIEVGISFASASSNAEVRQIIVPPALSQVGAPGAIFYPLAVGYGARISVRTLSSTGASVNAGEMDMSALYN